MSQSNPNETAGRDPSAEDKIGRGRARFTWLLLAVCLIQFVLLAVVMSGHRRFPDSPAQPGNQPAPANSGSPELYLNDRPGLWGNLEYARIALEPPNEFIPAAGDFFGPTRWFFEGYTPATLMDFFSQCGLPAAQYASLTNAATWSVNPDGVWVAPSDALVLDLAEPARQRIYSVLAKSHANTLKLWPFKARTDSFEAWFGDAGLSAETLALLKKLTYHRGDYLCISDIGVVFPRIATAEERRRLVKRLARTSTLLMKLQIKPDSDVKALADYWATGPRSKDIEALLASLTRVPGGMTIDVAHLLPPFARKRLYTFPLPPTNSAAGWPDCNWTAMNFFRDPPDNRFYDFDECGKELDQNYTKVKQAVFGDLIVFYRPDGFPIHIVVYIADDVVFTKNGNSTFHPWTLMKWNDLIEAYTLDYSPDYIIFHPKTQME